MQQQQQDEEKKKDFHAMIMTGVLTTFKNLSLTREEGWRGGDRGCEEKEARKRCRRFEFISLQIKKAGKKVRRERERERERSDTLRSKQPERVFSSTHLLASIIMMWKEEKKGIENLVGRRSWDAWLMPVRVREREERRRREERESEKSYGCYRLRLL